MNIILTHIKITISILKQLRMEVKFFDKIEHNWNQFLTILPEVLLSLLILFIFYIIGRNTSKLMRKRLYVRTNDGLLSGFFAKISKWIVFIIGLIIAMDILGLASLASGIITGAGISAVILGFAFKNIGENFLSGLLLAFNRPFNIGDLIVTSGFTGTITSMDFRTTNIKTEEGKDVYIPNSHILNNPLTNISREGLRRFDFAIQLDYNNDIVLAKKLISLAVSEIAEVLKKPSPIIVVDQLTATVSIKVYYWIDALKAERAILEIKGEVIEGSKRHLAEGGIVISDLTQIKITNETLPLKIQS